MMFMTQYVRLISDEAVRQWINKYGWKLENDGNVFVMNQEENIKTKNITEKITYDSKLVILNQRHGKYQIKNITEKITYDMTESY